VVGAGELGDGAGERWRSAAAGWLVAQGQCAATVQNYAAVRTQGGDARSGAAAGVTEVGGATMRGGARAGMQNAVEDGSGAGAGRHGAEKRW